MLIHRTPSFKPAAHARDVLKTIFDEKRRRSQTAIAVITIHHYRLFLVGVLQKRLDVAVVELKPAGNVRLAIGGGIANVDEQTTLLVELLFSLVNGYLGNFHIALLASCCRFIKLESSCPQREIFRRLRRLEAGQLL